MNENKDHMEHEELQREYLILAQKVLQLSRNVLLVNLRYGCKEYFAHNKKLLFYERQKEIIRELEHVKLDLPEV